MIDIANILLDEDGCIRSWNARAQRMFGHAGNEILGQPVSRLYADLDEELLQRMIGEARSAGGNDWRSACQRKEGFRFASHSLITPLGDAAQPGGHSLVVREIEEPQGGAGRGAGTAAQLEAIFRSAMDAIVTVDESQTVVMFNAAAERIFGCPATEVIGAPLERFIPERFRATHRSHIEQFGRTGTTTRMMSGAVLYGLRASGEEFPLDASISQVTVAGERLYTVILRDVSERERAQEALEDSYREFRELAGMMNEAREAERTRIARELHDELAQLLTALKMDVSWLTARLPADQQSLAARGEKMKTLVDATVASVRRISTDLRPVMLDDLGLLPSIEHLLHSLSERAGVVVSLDAPAGGCEFPEPLATSIYRMVQEALTNVARHARATEVRMVCGVENGILRLRVADNGVGLPATPPARRSFGLMGIRERAQTLGGAARIESPATGGTVVEITIPMAPFAGGEAELT